MDFGNRYCMEDFETRFEQARQDQELAAQLAAQFEYEDSVQARDAKIAADLAAKLELEDNVDRLKRRFPEYDGEVLRSYLEAFNGNVDQVVRELAPPGEFREELQRGPIAIPEAEDGSGLLITDCNIAFPSLSEGAKNTRAPAIPLGAVASPNPTPMATPPKPSYASRAAELTTDDHFKWIRLSNQYPDIDDAELMDIFLSTGRHLQETIEKLQKREKEKSAPLPEPVIVQEERPRSYSYGIDPDAVRAEASYHKEQAQWFMDLSNDPNIKRKFPDLARYYRVMSEAHIHQHMEENDKAAIKIAAAVNQGKDPFTLDLHYLYENEAIEQLTAWMQFHTDDLGRTQNHGRKSRMLKVITGKGLHSKKGKSKLQPCVFKYLTDNGYSFDPMDGFFIVRITC